MLVIILQLLGNALEYIMIAECTQGQFGENCHTSCNCEGICDRFIGTCHGGICQAGYKGIDCQIGALKLNVYIVKMINWQCA